MIDRDHHHVSPAGQILSVNPRPSAALRREASSVTPRHHGPFAIGIGARRPDVEAETIFVITLDRGIRLWRKNLYRVEILRRLVTESHCIPHASPRLRLSGSHESHSSASGGSVGN